MQTLTIIVVIAVSAAWVRAFWIAGVRWKGAMSATARAYLNRVKWIDAPTDKPDVHE